MADHLTHALKPTDLGEAPQKPGGSARPMQKLRAAVMDDAEQQPLKPVKLGPRITASLALFDEEQGPLAKATAEPTRPEEAWPPASITRPRSHTTPAIA